VRAIQSRLEDIESSVCGPADSRLSQVTMLEILQKCKAVHQANESMIGILEKKLSAQGKKLSKAIPSISKGADSECNFIPFIDDSLIAVSLSFTHFISTQ
jgi:hypothetical protein